MAFDLLSALRPQAWAAATWAYSKLRLGQVVRPGLRILAYHSIGTQIEEDAFGVFNMAPDRFQQQMRHLSSRYANQFMPLELGALTRGAPGIMVTFDDGYRDNLSVAAPLLAELGIPFTVFVRTDAVSQCRAGFLGPDDVRELAIMPGARIGSHSATHARLTDCDDLALARELSGSKAYLEDLLGIEIDLLAYPYGAVDRRVRDMAEKTGYRAGVTSRLDRNLPGRDPMLLSSVTIYAHDDIEIFEQKLQGKWDWYRWRHADPSCGK